MEVQEKINKPMSGYIMFVVLLGVIGFGGFSFVTTKNPFILILLVPLVLFLLKGFFIVNPNQSKVLVLFGKYSGTVRDNGFFWTNPFYTRRTLSLRAFNFETERVKVNDSMGNPILISAILVWKVKETFKAAFEVNDHEKFVRVQSDAAVRILANQYPYDNFDDDMSEVTLRSGLDIVNEALESAISDRLAIAGIEVLEARIGYLAYAPEIASAMLKRQQAEAIVAARLKIVEGAVGMVESALQQLSEKNIIELDEEKKATMVNNLMVVLCSDKEATPVLNSGTLHT